MPTLTERIESDYKTALKARDQRRVDTLRLIKAALQRTAMDKRKDALDDAEVIQVLSQQAKQRRETLASATQGGRRDIVTQSEEELAILGDYLPKQLSTEQLRSLVNDAFQTVGPNQGLIMKTVMAKAAGAADGKIVSQMVAERLKQAGS